MPETIDLRIHREARRAGVPQEVVEKDYAVGHVLAAIYGHSALRGQLVFKGGTALRKGYFSGYRFSEDLDFTALAPGRPLEEALRAVAGEAAESLRAQGDFDITVTRYPSREAHPAGQEAFRFHVRFPWQSQSLCSLKIEVTTDEPLLSDAVERSLIHGYDEELECTLLCYSLEEIVAEKLRATLQMQARLAARGWARPRSRGQGRRCSPSWRRDLPAITIGQTSASGSLLARKGVFDLGIA